MFIVVEFELVKKKGAKLKHAVLYLILSMLWSEPIARINVRKELCIELAVTTRDNIPRHRLKDVTQIPQTYQS